jgi:hypothetical protein
MGRVTIMETMIMKAGKGGSQKINRAWPLFHTIKTKLKGQAALSHIIPRKAAVSFGFT